MPFIQSLVVASSLFYIAAAAPALSVRSLSCPASNNTVYTTGSNSYSIECGIDRNAGDMPAPNGKQAATLEACIAQCEARSGCILVDYVAGPKACYLKSKVGATKSNSAVIGARLVTGAASSITSSPSSSPSTTSTSVVSVISTPAVYVPSVLSTTSTSSAATTTLSTAVATPTLTSTSKRGICFNKNPNTLFFGGSGSKVSWGYNW